MAVRVINFSYSWVLSIDFDGQGWFFGLEIQGGFHGS
jgi:hypothetical protein